MASIVHLPAVGLAFFEEDVLDRTIKLTCQGASLVTVVSMLNRYGVAASDVEAIGTGAPFESGYTVTMKSRETVDKLRQVENLNYRNYHFSITALNKQVINVRVHWMPHYLSDNLLKSVFADYGRVLNVQRLSQSYGQSLIHNGVREVTLEVTEIQRLAVPHLLKFEGGLSMLLTVAGRPPLCLRCSRVGHMRRQCPVFMDTRRSYSGVARQAEKQPAPEARTEEQQAEEQNVVEDKQGVETADMEVVAEEARGEKRGGHSDEEDVTETSKVMDSFRENFPKQKQRRSRVASTPAIGDPAPVPTSNPFDVLVIDETVVSPAVLIPGLDNVMESLLDL